MFSWQKLPREFAEAEKITVIEYIPTFTLC